MGIRLDVGSRIGVYEIAGRLGAGGMGEVWRARDTRLGRDVAVKILPAPFVSDGERLHRFDREAKLLASLNHPNIGAIYGIEDAGGTPVLILELVDGGTLADRIAGQPMPVSAVLEIGLQIADALDAAHEKGVIHRDLKPANIKVTSQGLVKVLDFGLAKAVEIDAAGVLVSQSPTLSLAPTAHGLILGTAPYMSPEQARGVAVDKRTDIWAFGCVLFEMLTGRHAFAGELVSDVIASVLKSDPDYRQLPAAIDVRLQALIERCLDKDPRRRWRDIGDVRAELVNIRDTPPADAAVASARSRRYQRLAWVAAMLIAAAAAAIGWPRGGTPDAVRTSPIAFEFSPPGASLYPGVWMVPFAVAPDGRWLAYTATSNGAASRLWIREMSSLVAQEVQGTDGAVAPFWSRDGKWVGFFAANVLYRVSIPGGTPQTVARGLDARSASWVGDDLILAAGRGGGIQAISVKSGSVTRLTTPAPDEIAHRWPQPVGDGIRFLYTTAAARPRVYLASARSNTRELVTELRAPSSIQYVRGYLFYVEDAVLWAQPLNDRTLAVAGPRRRVASDVPTGGPGTAPFSVAEDSLLVYWTQSLIQNVAQLQWMNRRGDVIGLVGKPVVYDGFDLSPDGSRIAAAQVGRQGTDIWIYEVGGNAAYPAPFNSESSNDTVPVWSPDGRSLTYLAPGSEGLALKRADARGGAPVELVTSPRNQLPSGWTRNARELVFDDFRAETGDDILVFHADEGRIQSLPIDTPANERAGRLSPDDKWIAYMTDQSGQNEIWLAAYPSGQPRRQISQSGGTHPAWNGDGTELFYISKSGRLIAVPFRGASDSGLVTGPQAELFQMPGPIDIVAGSHNMYKPTADGQRFLVAAKGQPDGVPPLQGIVNWRHVLDR